MRAIMTASTMPSRATRPAAKTPIAVSISMMAVMTVSSLLRAEELSGDVVPVLGVELACHAGNRRAAVVHGRGERHLRGEPHRQQATLLLDPVARCLAGEELRLVAGPPRGADLEE